jgi:hypothetical protein
MRKFTLALVLLVIATIPAYGAVDDSFDATCRVTTPDGGTGTACVYSIGPRYVMAITAKHVLDGTQRVYCEFWRAGHKSTKIPAFVAERAKNCDAGVIAIPREAFKGLLPRVIPLAPSKMILRRGDTIMSTGCANGSWATAWRGHLVAVEADELTFDPIPAQGRSGSAILDESGSYIVGILVAQNLTLQKGVAVPINQARNDINAQAQRQLDYRKTQCFGGQCPQPGTQPQGLFGNRGGHIQIGGGQGVNIGRGVYPTMPDTPNAPPVVPVIPPPVQQPQIVYVPQQPAVPADSTPTEISVDMSGVAAAMDKQADAAVKISESISAYVDAQTAPQAAEQTQQGVQGVIGAARDGYEQRGVVGAVATAATSEAAIGMAQTAAVTFLPPPYSTIAYVIIGIIGTIASKFVGAWVVRKGQEVAAANRASKLNSSERTAFDDLEDAKTAYRTNGNGNGKQNKLPT